MSAFDVPTQIWLEKAKVAFDHAADALRCPLCLRGVRNGSEEDLAANCRHRRKGAALPCPMAVNHEAEKAA